MAEPPYISTAQENTSIPATAPPPNPLAHPTVTPIAGHGAAPMAESSQNKRPRDAHIIHMVLASQGVTAYEERTLLQLFDFAYRYTTGVFQDVVHVNAEGYLKPGGAGAGSSSAAAAATAATAGGGDAANLNIAAVRLGIDSRSQYQMDPRPPKEFLLETATLRNRVHVPGVGREWGAKLPPERYCLTGVGWGLKEEWESEQDEEMEDVDRPGGDHGQQEQNGEVGAGDEGDEEEEDATEPRMEDLFGDPTGDGEGDEEDADGMRMEG